LREQHHHHTERRRDHWHGDKVAGRLESNAIPGRSNRQIKATAPTASLSRSWRRCQNFCPTAKQAAFNQGHPTNLIFRTESRDRYPASAAPPRRVMNSRRLICHPRKVGSPILSITDRNQGACAPDHGCAPGRISRRRGSVSGYEMPFTAPRLTGPAARLPSWVIKSQSNMSAMVAAFAESSHRDPFRTAVRCDTLELANLCSQCS
jgi:hypothetical protein